MMMDGIVTEMLAKIKESQRLYPVQSADGKRVRRVFYLITDCDVRFTLERYASFMAEQLSRYDSNGFEAYYKDLPIWGIRVNSVEELLGILSIPPANLMDRIRDVYLKEGDKAAYYMPEPCCEGDVVSVPVGIFMFKDLKYWQALNGVTSGFTYRYAVADKKIMWSPEFVEAIRRIGMDGIFFSLLHFLHQVHLPSRDNEVLYKIEALERKALIKLGEQFQEELEKNMLKAKCWKGYSIAAGILSAVSLGLAVWAWPEIYAKLQTLVGGIFG